MEFMRVVDFNSLLSEIERRLNHSDTIRNPPLREILEFAEKEVKSVKEFGARMNWSGLLSEYMKINDEVRRLTFILEDIVDPSSMEVEGLKQDFEHLVALAKKMEEEHVDGLYNNPFTPQDEEEGDNDVDVSGSKMIGLSDQYCELKEKLLTLTDREVVALVGMPGIGKTTLAVKVFADPDIVERFDVRVWVRVGGGCPLEEIWRRILAWVDPDRANEITVESEVVRRLRESLEGKRYLIVLDDVWDRNMQFDLQKAYRYGVTTWADPFPYQENGSCILLTTRLQQGQDFAIRLLNNEESWDLLREKVFGEESCPSQLEKAGKKIAENCEGLPLTIITIADHLSEVKEVEYWDEIAAKKNHNLYKDVYDEISKVILPSYNYLPRLLQLCFLYVGIFPQNYQIARSKLVDMWSIDGFLERKHKFYALDCLEELVLNSLVMIHKNTCSNMGQKDIKSCGLHSSLWHFSTTEARKTKFCHVLSSLDDGLNENVIGQERLSFHNNILCSIKDVYEFVEDNCASTTRSLLYYGPYNPFQVPVCFGLRLLRELDILTIRFYEFPTEILRLVELRYLALTLDRKLPTSISQLSKLRFLIVGRHFVVIKPTRDQYLPVEIWNMQELQHLQAMGSDLPYPPRGASLENLSTLSNISAYRCTEEVFKAIPNLKKLGLRIELGPNDEGIPLRFFDHLFHLEELTSLKCVVVNPNIATCRGDLLTSFRSAVKKFRRSKLGSEVTNEDIYHHEKLRYLENVVASPKLVPPVATFAILPPRLTKLSLSGLGLPWKEMRKIADLPGLLALKLQNYAFTRPYWRVKSHEFYVLRSLVIEDNDIVEWSLESESFSCLQNLTLKHCYIYERMVGQLGDYVKKIEFFACNPSGIRQMQETMIDPLIEWRCNSSFIDGENETQ